MMTQVNAIVPVCRSRLKETPFDFSVISLYSGVPVDRIIKIHVGDFKLIEPEQASLVIKTVDKLNSGKIIHRSETQQLLEEERESFFYNFTTKADSSLRNELKNLICENILDLTKDRKTALREYCSELNCSLSYATFIRKKMFQKVSVKLLWQLYKVITGKEFKIPDKFLEY